MKNILIASVIGFFPFTLFAASLLGETQQIVDLSPKGVPQVPTLSPDGKHLVYEVAGKKGTSLWISDADGKNARSLSDAFQSTGKLPAVVENASWHPQGGFIVFEGSVGPGKHQIYSARFENGKISEPVKLMMGRRPRFSYPYGRTLFCEVGESLRYVVIGADPLKPRDLEYVPLRGPIQLAESMEFTHPNLSRDGNTILFAAGAGLPHSSNPYAYSGFYESVIKPLHLDGPGRQRLMLNWPKLAALPQEKLVVALQSISDVFKKVDAPLVPNSMDRELGEVFEREFSKMNLSLPVKGIPGINRRDLLHAWAFGFLIDRTLPQSEVNKRLATKIWSTDLFGGGLKAIAESAPVPQKFPVATADSAFAVFEAGLYNNRQLYVVNLSNGKSAALTTKGTYNSSPGLSADDKTVYFESNEAGKKQIRKASIDWDAVRANLK